MTSAGVFAPAVPQGAAQPIEEERERGENTGNLATIREKYNQDDN